MKYKIVERANGYVEVWTQFLRADWEPLQSFTDDGGPLTPYEAAREYVRSLVPGDAILREEIVEVE